MENRANRSASESQAIQLLLLFFDAGRNNVSASRVARSQFTTTQFAMFSPITLTLLTSQSLGKVAVVSVVAVVDVHLFI